MEVYGRTKQHAEYTHTGQRNLRPHLGFWAEAGVPLAAELMAGAEDPRSNGVQMLDRSIAALPAGVQQIRCRWDAGYFAGELAHACLQRGVQFAIGVKRTRPVIAAAAEVPERQWIPAVGMDDTEVAVTAYRPASWPGADDGVVCIARRTRIPAERIPTQRARKRRTIPTDQLTLALEGRLDHVYGYSFILTNLPVGTAEQLAEVEWWYRHRTDIEALNKDAKFGAALRHLPSVILSQLVDHGSDLGVFVVVGVHDMVGGVAGQHGPVSFGTCFSGVSRSRRGVAPRIAEVRRSPSAWASASRSSRLSCSSCRIRSVAASRRRSREVSEARCRSGGTALEGGGWWRSRSRSTSRRRSAWA